MNSCLHLSNKFKEYGKFFSHFIIDSDKEWAAANTLSQCPGGGYCIHQGKCQIFRNFPGLDLGVNFLPGRQQNQPGWYEK